MTSEPAAPEVTHRLTFWRSLLAWLGWGRHIAVCGADLDAEQPNLPLCPDCATRTRRHRTREHEEVVMSETRSWDGKPETEADRRFFDLRESGYTGPIDQDGYAAGPDWPAGATR